MFKVLSDLGEKISKFMGDVDLGISKENGDEPFTSITSFANLLPYEAFDEESGLFCGKNTLGFAIEAVPMVGGDPTAQKVLSSLFTDLLDEEASIQCLLFADNRTEKFLNFWEEPRQGSNEILKKLAKKRTDHFKKSSHLSPRLFRFVISYSMNVCDSSVPEKISLIKEKKEKFLELLKSLTHAKSWLPEDLLEFVGGMTNFSLSTQVKKRQWNKYQDLASQINLGGKLSIEEECLKWNTDTNSVFKSYRVSEYPNYWSFQNMQSLIGDVLREGFRIKVPFYLHFGVHCPKQTLQEGNFNKKSILIENQGRSSILSRWIPQLENELKENRYIRKALHEGARFVWTQFSAGIWGKKENINQAEQALKGLFRINQFLLADNRCIHSPQFIAALPMTWATYAHDLKNLNLLRTTITSECVNFIPIQGEWSGTSSPGMLLIGRRGQLLNWNQFDNKIGNYNVIVAGRSGGGKSVFMQDLLVSGLGVGAKVFILDVGRSFEKMCDLLNGQQIEFSKGSAICLNPFSNISVQDEDDKDTALNLVKTIVSSMAAPSHGTSDLENSFIEKAIAAAWMKKKTDATISDIAEWLENQTEQTATNLAIMLTPYIKGGVYAKHFEGNNNVNFSNDLVLIELEELKGKKELQTVVLQLFMIAITDQAFLGNRKRPFIICIDEAWDLLKSKQAGPFIETLARRLRKYYGSLVIGTQNLQDFFNTPGATAAFENSDWMCLLSQYPVSISALAEQKRLHFDEAKKHALASVTKRDGLFSEVMILDAEGNYSIARLILDPFSDLLYTTHPHEYTIIKELREKGLSVSDAIEKCLSMRVKNA
jgi:conjugal transfer ATP-binding protein TraC